MVSFACVIVAVTTLLQLGLIDHFAIAHASQEAELRLQQLSLQMRDALDRTLDQATHDVQLLSALPDLREANSPDTARHILENLQRADPDYAWIGIAKPDGKVMAATGGMLENRDVTMRPWFHTGQQKLVTEDYHPAILLGNLLPRSEDPWRFVDIAGPIRDSQGNLRGVLAIHLSWQWARTLARELLTPVIREFGAEILIVRSDGFVLLGPSHLVEQRITTDSLKLAWQGKSGAIEERWPDGQMYLTGFSLTGRNLDRPGLQWAVLVRQTESKAMASAHAFEHRMLWLSGSLAAVLAIGAAMLARRIVKPLNVLSGAIEDLAQAPASAAPAVIPEVGSFHEAHVLSEALRHLVDSERRHRDALERMNAELEETVAARTAELHQLVMRDALTGLPNRRALMQLLPEAMARAARLGRLCAVLFLDMDGFKLVNDTRGHEQGDELLRQFATRIRDSIRETDTAVRLAGDEFVVILDMVNERSDAEHKARLLLSQLTRPFPLHGGSVTVGASIGLAVQLPHQRQDPTGLLARADQAMYDAKRKGKGRVSVAAIDLENSAP
ncbi:sensor domain-containing diguanylate cyclase [Massilia sp. 9096]|uniref:sensor domain-containing diguanylate cyclase n=1 Tax=Massilia sp. 9096 TaxID=1500894 RepID=UPI001EFA9A95|nr:sensor domain-containing diguanylate cyclase [Massilia sp. 9096]